MQRTYKFRLYPTKEAQEKIHFVLERCQRENSTSPNSKMSIPKSSNMS